MRIHPDPNAHEIVAAEALAESHRCSRGYGATASTRSSTSFDAIRLEGADLRAEWQHSAEPIVVIQRAVAKYGAPEEPVDPA